ncbi:unnamed protein product [Larinioides sclopetarius]|uniref:Uncharacterized protein n=1 Tax=Larinioides sclopetarius TaxID=280406 RepID=A0AAV2AXN9_9ARAC
MKTFDGSSRIFGKDPESWKKDSGLSFANLVEIDNGHSTVSNLNANSNSSNALTWIEQECLSSIQETSSWCTDNENDAWLKQNRLRALHQLLSTSHAGCSSSSISSCNADSNEILQVKNNDSQAKILNCCEGSHDEAEIKGSRLAKLPSYNVSSLMVLKSETGFYDAHCHIDFLLRNERFTGTYADYIAKHKDSYPKSYKGCITVFCKPHSFAEKNVWGKILVQDNVWGAFGCHPKSANFYNDRIERDLERALCHGKVRALGEIGLDYSERSECPTKKQHDVFRRQLKIAQRRKFHVVIHCRDADDDAIKIMHEILPKDTIFHLHCFTGNWKTAQKWIKAFPNVYIGITNLVTFSSAVETHGVARYIPLNRLLLETDAPYFVPTKVRSSSRARFSHPGMAIHVAAQIAAIKNIRIEEVLRSTCVNTQVVYNIP